MLSLQNSHYTMNLRVRGTQNCNEQLVKEKQKNIIITKSECSNLQIELNIIGLKKTKILASRNAEKLETNKTLHVVDSCLTNANMKQQHNKGNFLKYITSSIDQFSF